MYRIREIDELAFRKHEVHEAMTSQCNAEKYKYQSTFSLGKSSALTYVSRAKEQGE